MNWHINGPGIFHSYCVVVCCSADFVLLVLVIIVLNLVNSSIIALWGGVGV